MIFLRVSSWNYPGAYAVQSLHEHLHQKVNFSDAAVIIDGTNRMHALNSVSNSVSELLVQSDLASVKTVHVCTLATMTGMSRFIQLPYLLRYDKTENIDEARLLLADQYNTFSNISDIHQEYVDKLGNRYYKNFAYLISEIHHIGGYKLIQCIEQFDSSKSWISHFTTVQTKPMLYLHQRMDVY
jgi:hypothetical protein